MATDDQNRWDDLDPAAGEPVHDVPLGRHSKRSLQSRPTLHHVPDPAHASRAAGSPFDRISAPQPAASPEPREEKRRKRGILPLFLIGAGVVLLGIALYLFASAWMGYRQAQEVYSGLRDYAVQDGSGDNVPAVDFDALHEINPEIVAWIYVPNTEINYPVVQADNNEKYLNTLFDLTPNASGAIFLDMDDTPPGVVDQQTTVYGHHMNDGEMFNVIDRSQKQDVFDTFTNVYYITPQATYRFEPLFTSEIEDSYTDARMPNFPDEDAFENYLQAMLAQAKASCEDAAYRVKDTKKALTLVTCAGTIMPGSKRSVMVCELMETVEVDAAAGQSSAQQEAQTP